MQQTSPQSAPQVATHELCNVAAERAILHALLNGRDVNLVLRESLQPDMFYTYVHSWIFAAMLDLHRDKSEIGVLTVIDAVRNRGELNTLRDGKYTGEALIRWLQSDEAAPDGSETLRGNAKIVKEKATRRLMKLRAVELNNMADDETVPASTQITQFSNRLDEIKPFNLDDEFIKAGDALSTHYDILCAKAQYKSWGITPWQTLTDRGIILRDDTLVCVIGPEGSGKSALLATWAENSAREGIKAAYIHTEMTANDVLDRAAVRRDKRIRYSELLKPDEISPATWGILTDELNQGDPYNHNLYTWHAGAGVTEEKLLIAMSRLADDYGVREFHIDYLNDFVPEQAKNENKTGAWRNFLANIEAWCEAHHARVIFAAQMNKDGGAYEIGRAARQKAHLYFEIETELAEFPITYKYDGVTYGIQPKQKRPIHTINIHKVRHGPGAGPVQLLFVGPRYLWVDVQKDDATPPQRDAPDWVK